MAAYNKPWDYVVFIFIIVFLVIGWSIKMSVETRTNSFIDAESSISLNYPASWVIMPEEGALLAVIDPQTPSTFSTRFTMHTSTWNKEIGLTNFIVQFSADRGRSLTLYRIISINPFDIGDLKAMKVEYAYAINPIGVRAGVTSVPIVVRAFDVIVAKGDQMYIFTCAADENEYSNNASTFNTIVKSIRIQ